MYWSELHVGALSMYCGVLGTTPSYPVVLCMAWVCIMPCRSELGAYGAPGAPECEGISGDRSDSMPLV